MDGLRISWQTTNSLAYEAMEAERAATRIERAPTCMPCLLHGRHVRCEDRLHCGCCGVAGTRKMPRKPATVDRRAAHRKRKLEDDPEAFRAYHAKKMREYRARKKAEREHVPGV